MKSSPQEICIRAYQLYVEELDADVVAERLVSEGFSHEMASRAVVFLPSAFARVHYRNAGLSFPAHFFAGFLAYEEGRKSLYVDEPVFEAAIELAQQLARDGDSSQVWRFVEISAEHKGLTEVRDRGLTPKSFPVSIHTF
ncbi:MAG: hypothetical protein SFY80_02485 [Verrucomicrobiota bacterium]|nr:hypothetical protein [Verrucomicrobiota bacterium]